MATDKLRPSFLVDLTGVRMTTIASFFLIYKLVYLLLVTGTKILLAWRKDLNALERNRTI